MEVLKDLRQGQFPNFFPKLKGLTTMKHLPKVIPLQPYIIGKFIKWTSSLPFYMLIYRRKFIWKNLLDMFRITLVLSVSLRNPYMALSKLLELGMQKWISFSLTLVFLDAILTPKSIPRKPANHLIILFLYVDDLILIGSDPKLITHVKSNIKQNFEMLEVGNLHYFLGLQVLQTKEGIFLSQSMYACDLLRCFSLPVWIQTFLHLYFP